MFHGQGTPPSAPKFVLHRSVTFTNFQKARAPANLFEFSTALSIRSSRREPNDNANLPGLGHGTQTLRIIVPHLEKYQGLRGAAAKVLWTIRYATFTFRGAAMTESREAAMIESSTMHWGRLKRVFGAFRGRN